jgi:hypothetical protein
VQVQDDPGAGPGGGLQRAPAEQRMDVVGVNHLGAELDDGTADRVGRKAASGHRRRGAEAAEIGARTLQQPDRMAVARQHLDQIRDGALLAAARAIPVVEHQDAHRRLTLTDGSARLAVRRRRSHATDRCWVSNGTMCHV